MEYKVLIFGVIVLVNLCFAQESAIIDISPPQTKNPGESVTLSCTVRKPENIFVSWMKGIQMLTLGSQSVFFNPSINITVNGDTYNLHIENLNASDTGSYVCQINADPTRIVKKSVDLQVTRPPSIIGDTEDNVRVAEGSAATLTCNADGFPAPAIVWKREDEEIFSSKGNSFRGSNLTILQVKKEDRGRYICEASNKIGNPVTKSVLLEVNFGPIMQAKRPKVGQKEGYEAQLDCIVTAYPPAAVSWLRDNKELNNNEHFEIAYIGAKNEITTSTLKLKNVAQHHYGEYTCKAKNLIGEGETALELFEQEIPNELFSMFRKSSGHRFIGFHSLYAVIGIIIFTLFH